MMIAAALAGAAGAGFDKVLLQDRPPPLFVLGFLLPYLAGLLGLLLLVAWVPHRKRTTPFRFRPAMLLVPIPRPSYP